MLLDSLPSCFSKPQNPTNSNKNSTKTNQNLVTCIYQTRICNAPIFLTLTWSKTLASHSLTINIDSFSLSLSMSKSSFSFFRSKPGSKSISLSHHHHHKPKLYWDFTRAHFSPTSAEPISGFYLTITYKNRIEFLVGDLQQDAIRGTGAVHPIPPEPTLLSRREHVFGRQNFTIKAQFLGSDHDISIECAGGSLKVKVDGAIGLVVKRLMWKFRGNQRILVGASDVEFYWDVYNWVFGSTNGCGGHGVFVFQVGDGGVWPDLVGPEKRLMRKSFSSSSTTSSPGNWSVLQWSEERSDNGRSCSSISSCSSSSASSGGFSLLLYAWRTD